MMFLKIFSICILSASVSCGRYNYDDDDDDSGEPVPYNFGYAIQNLGSAQFRKETSDGHGAVKGSYGFTDENGIRREVHYVADHNGFRAQVKTNEPGTISGNPADVTLQSNGRHHEDFHQFRHHF